MKKTFILTILFLLVTGHTSLAHTGLQSSSPEQGAVVEEEVDTIYMDFDTDIEETSDFELQNSAGDTVPVEDITIEGNTMTGTPAEPLTTEEYQVQWNVIGADGHPIEGEFSFSVERPESETSTEPEENETTAESGDEGENTEEGTEAGDAAAGEEEGSNAALIPGLVVVLLVVLLGSLWWMLRRKK